MALSDVIATLACPRCQAALALDDKTLHCDAGHAFDVAKQGYVNLLGSAQPQHADTAAMLTARDTFLSAGHYTPIADAVAARLGSAARILDAGAGTGWYLSRWVDVHPDRTGLALDISTAACRRAARTHARIGAVVADTWGRLPVRDGSVDAVTCVFAPRHVTEFARVLRPGGVFVAVTPTMAHLREARELLGLMRIEEEKSAKLLRATSGILDGIGQTTVTRTLHLAPEHLTLLVDMGPNAFHEHGVADDALDVTLDVTVSWFRKPTR